MKSVQLTVITTKDFSDIVSLALIESGSEGTNIYDAEEFKDFLKNGSWDYVDDDLIAALESQKNVLVSGYFSEKTDLNLVYSELETLKQNSPSQITGSMETSVKIIDSADWENVWKQYYTPITIGKITIVPSWLKHTDADTIPVFINPGMAFGTGSHETTSMVIDLMQAIDLNDKTVVDVGTGSGILGIAGLKLGAKNCCFIDVDENAVKAANDNIKLNALENKSTVRQGSLLKDDEFCYDVIFANLTADLLKMLYQDLKSSLKKGGKIAISGIIDKRRDEVQKQYSDGFKHLKTLVKGDWTAILLEKE